jgi:hypothetical protein
MAVRKHCIPAIRRDIVRDNFGLRSGATDWLLEIQSH